jgi:3-phosphoshikimate 1-carboxyvinyltransferase
MEKMIVAPPAGRIAKGKVRLNGSKSIANRVQVIRALCGEHFDIQNLSNADDTLTLEGLLASSETVLDAGAGGTTYRFLTAYLATRTGEEHLLTGSKRMLERPIGILVDALRLLGADITYIENEGYPPLRIRGRQLTGHPIAIPADTSSQYISALLMIAPTLSGGLTMALKGNIVSRPYIEMTLSMMAFFGVKYTFEGNTIRVEEDPYQARPFFVEADWSAASYYYAIAALSNRAEITLFGLSADSLQGDAVIAEIMALLGVATVYGEHEIVLRKIPGFTLPEKMVYDFVACPDLAQTVVVVCAALRIPAEFSGLQTLLIKETDRVEALHRELNKYGATFRRVAENSWVLDVSRVNLNQETLPVIATYDDHRMAMAFAPLCLVTGEMAIAEPGVVSKSYPAFWHDLQGLGFKIK